MYTQFLFLAVFVAFPYFIIIFRNLIWDVYLWQVKEYRWDRVISQWMFEKDKGLRTELELALKISLLTIAIAYCIQPRADVLVMSLILAFLFYWYEGLRFLQRLWQRKLLRPNIRSVRNLLIVVLFGVIVLTPFVAFCVWMGGLNFSSAMAGQTIITEPSGADQFIKQLLPRDMNGLVAFSAEYTVVLFITIFGLLADLTGPLWVMLGVALTWPLSAIKRKLMIESAKSLMLKRKKLKVVAVTGSYGKSTTKELIYQILAKKFKTVKTEKNNNTDVGIAQTILRKINSETEVFVAEMGAYKIGETRDCCLIAQPDIAIITGVDQQHVSLFGGIPQVIESTYEVVAEMKESGLAILNGDNEYCVKIAEKTTKRKMLYFSIHNSSKFEASEIDFEDEAVPIKHSVSFPANENVFVKEIEFTNKGVSFGLHYEGKVYHVSTNLKAIYNISNLMAAMLTAQELGMPMGEIVDIINEMNFNVPYLNTFPGINGSKILDDGYNANPTGFLAALKYFESLKVKTKKWGMTQGMIELGPERAATNKKLATAIIDTLDAFYTTDRALFEQVKNLKPEFEAVLVKSVFDFPIYFKHFVKEGQVVLLEGAFPQDVLKQIYVKYVD